MLEYGWGNAGEVRISGENTGQAAQVLDQYQQSLPAGNFFPSTIPLSSASHSLYPHPELQTTTNKLDALYPLPYERHPWPPSSLAEIIPGLPYRHPAPKTEELSGPSNNGEFPARIGLNLGGRTYFSSSSEDDFLSRLYRRTRAADAGLANSTRCQAEGCTADLTHAKHYHRRHKVCEFHSKTAAVVAAGLTQRFCQQCSRFHLLSEFDQGKRSCRRRLADHNRRRRKSLPGLHSHSGSNGGSTLAVKAATSKSSSESGGASRSSSVTIAVSPPRTALDCFRSGRQEAASSSSSSSLVVSSPVKFGLLDRSRIWDDQH